MHTFTSHLLSHNKTNIRLGLSYDSPGVKRAARPKINKNLSSTLHSVPILSKQMKLRRIPTLIHSVNEEIPST